MKVADQKHDSPAKAKPGKGKANAEDPGKPAKAKPGKGKVHPVDLEDPGKNDALSQDKKSSSGATTGILIATVTILIIGGVAAFYFCGNTEAAGGGAAGQGNTAPSPAAGADQSVAPQSGGPTSGGSADPGAGPATAGRGTGHRNDKSGTSIRAGGAAPFDQEEYTDMDDGSASGGFVLMDKDSQSSHGTSDDFQPAESERHDRPGYPMASPVSPLALGVRVQIHEDNVGLTGTVHTSLPDEDGDWHVKLDRGDNLWLKATELEVVPDLTMHTAKIEMHVIIKPTGSDGKSPYAVWKELGLDCGVPVNDDAYYRNVIARADHDWVGEITKLKAIFFGKDERWNNYAVQVEWACEWIDVKDSWVPVKWVHFTTNDISEGDFPPMG